MKPMDDSDDAFQMIRFLYLNALVEGDARRARGVFEAVTILRPDLKEELNRLDAERSSLRNDVPPFADEP